MTKESLNGQRGQNTIDLCMYIFTILIEYQGWSI